MQPKIQQRIQRSQQQNDRQKREDDKMLQVKIQDKPVVEAFDPNQVKELEIMREQNNLYGTLRQQEETSKIQILNIQAVIHKINTGDVRMDELFVPFGMGNQRRLTERHKKEYLETYMKMLQMEENKLKSLNGQRLHRGDEVGEQRLKVMRMLCAILVSQHGFTEDELFNHCKEYNDARLHPNELKMLPTTETLQDVINKAKQVE